MAKLQRMIRPSDMRDWTGLSRTVVDDLVRAGKFPKPIKLTDGGRAVAWLEEDVITWQEAKKAEREAILNAATAAAPIPKAKAPKRVQEEA